MSDAVIIENKATKSGRECGMIVVIGSQGFGKSVENKKVICRYVNDNLETKVRGRKMLILDTQGEYLSTEFGKDGIPPLTIKMIAVKDIEAWCGAPGETEARRVDMKSLHIDDKLKVLNYVLPHIHHIGVTLEDLNKITLTLSHLKDVVSSLIGLRHVGVDVLVSFQSLRAVEPRLYDNCQYVRLHYVSGSISAVSEKVGEPEVFQIGLLIIKKRVFDATQLYRAGKITEQEWKKRRAFFVLIYTKPFRIEGGFSKEEYVNACKKYLTINKRRVREEMDISDCTKEVAMATQCEELINEYYGNSDYASK